MDRLRKSLIYLFAVLFLGAIYGFLNAVVSPTAGLMHPGRVPLEPIGFSAAAGLSPLVTGLLLATSIISPSLSSVVMLIALVLHYYFIREVELDMQGYSIHIFGIVQAFLGPVPLLVYAFKND